MPTTTHATISQATGPITPQRKAIASRNATTHGLFARDIVLPSLGEDPDGYRKIEAEWMTQLAPRNLLERHYVEKIAAASWRLRRLHRWQAQLFEDETLTESERLDHLDKVMRHETALPRTGTGRQIDTAVKMLNKDVPQLYASRARDQVLEESQLSERECRESLRDESEVELETRGRLRRIRYATAQATAALSRAPLDSIPASPLSGSPELGGYWGGQGGENCENELPPACPPGYVRTEDKWIVRPADDFLPASGSPRIGG